MVVGDDSGSVRSGLPKVIAEDMAVFVGVRAFAGEAMGITRFSYDTTATTGDSPFDIQAGTAAGMATAAVTWGVFPRAALEAAKPDFVLERPADVVRVCVKETGARAGRRREPDHG